MRGLHQGLDEAAKAADQAGSRAGRLAEQQLPRYGFRPQGAPADTTASQDRPKTKAEMFEEDFGGNQFRIKDAAPQPRPASPAGPAAASQTPGPVSLLERDYHMTLQPIDRPHAGYILDAVREDPGLASIGRFLSPINPYDGPATALAKQKVQPATPAEGLPPVPLQFQYKDMDDNERTGRA